MPMPVDRSAGRCTLTSVRSRLASALLLGTAIVLPWSPGVADPLPPLDYMTLDFGDNQTFLTGIRGDNIVGNYVVPGTTATGGLLYNSATGTWSPFPYATPNGVNYPGADTASPYGPSFGSANGILRVVGSYKANGGTVDLGYLYDGAAAPGKELTTLIYPDPDVLFTILHSNFGNTAVGNYDTGPLTGNAFIYDIPTGAFTTNNKPGAISTTAYGVWGDKIAGGYGDFGPDGEPGFEHGYIYDRTTDTWKTYDHPGALVTHFEGITGAGRTDEYNLIADWVGIDGMHGSVLHVDADGNETWIPIEVPGATSTSVNSIHQNKVIGVYTDADGVHGFVVEVPGIYNPIHNLGTLKIDAPGAAAISAGVGDDVVNDGVIRAKGIKNVGVASDTYGVIYNNGLIAARGSGSAAVDMGGDFGTLLNSGILQARAGAVALRATGNAVGTTVVNTGLIDGRVKVKAGPDARFENSGVMGVLRKGAGVRHVVSGTFAQTEEGALALRIAGRRNDMLKVDGAARLGGTVAPLIQRGNLKNRYKLVTASDEITGTFDELDPIGLPRFLSASLDYSDTKVVLDLKAEFAKHKNLDRNQHAVAGGLDDAFNKGGGIDDGLNVALFDIAGSPGDALDMLSGEVYASEQSVLINEALFGRKALLDRIRQAGGGGGATGSDLALGYADAPAGNAPPFPGTQTGSPDPALWAQGLGSWSDIDGGKNAEDVSSSFGGILGGVDYRVNDWLVGLAWGYSQSNTDIDGLSSSARADTGTIAAYAGTTMGAWSLRAGASYGLNFIDSNRTVSFAGFKNNVKADYRAGTTQVFGEIGYQAMVQGVELEPFANLAWVHLQTESFKESGGAGALDGSSGSSDVGYTTIGFRAARDYVLPSGQVLTPRVSVAWQAAFGDLTPTAVLALAGTQGANFTVAGAPLAANTALIDAGFDLGVGGNAKVGLSYLGQFSSSDSNNAVWGSFTKAF